MGVYYDSERRHWRFQFQHLGHRYTGRGYGTKLEAKQAEAKERLRIGDRPGKTGMGFKEAANLYLDYAKERFIRQTYEYKVRVFKSFLATSGDMPIHEITPHHIHSHCRTRATAKNYNFHRKELSTLFVHLQRKHGLPIQNPCAQLDKLPEGKKRKYIPPEKDILAVIADAEPDTKDLLLCLLHTAGRIDEILRLQWEEVNFEKRSITLWTRKRRGGDWHADNLPMNDDLYAVLWRRYKTHKDASPYVFHHQDGTRYLRRPKLMPGLCKRAGVTPFGFHAIRHFVASYLADKQKISTKAIQEILRHRDARTTEIYLQSVGDSTREAMGTLSGLLAPKVTPTAKERDL